MATVTRATITREIELRLGGQMVDVELDLEHYQLAIDKALDRYRQRSENAVEEDFYYFEIQVDTNTYTLDEDIIDVIDLYGHLTGSQYSGYEFEPFGAQTFNTFLAAGSGSGGLAVYDFLAQYHETLGRLFGAEFLYTWRRQTNELILHRTPRSARPVYAHVFRERTEEDLFNDYRAKPWIKDYSLAQAKYMLGEARSKFGTFAGPQGGTTLNGDSLKADAIAEMEKLEEEIKLFKDGGSAWGVIIG